MGAVCSPIELGSWNWFIGDTTLEWIPFCIAVVCFIGAGRISWQIQRDSQNNSFFSESRCSHQNGSSFAIGAACASFTEFAPIFRQFRTPTTASRPPRGMLVFAGFHSQRFQISMSIKSREHFQRNTINEKLWCHSVTILSTFIGQTSFPLSKPETMSWISISVAFYFVKGKQATETRA